MASMKLFVFFVWISYGLCALVYAILAAEYNRVIIFKGPIVHKVLRGHVIRREKVANEGECRVKCFLEPNCVSINVGPAVAGNRSCELNNDTDESQSLLWRKKNFVHYSIENICNMNGDPCPGENNLCQVGFTDKRYRCVCRDGYRHRRGATNQCVGVKPQGDLSSQGYPSSTSPSQSMQLPLQQNIAPSAPSSKVPAGTPYTQQPQYPPQGTQPSQAPAQSYAPTSTQTQSGYPGGSTAAAYPTSQQSYSQTSQPGHTPQSQSYSAAGVTPYSSTGQSQMQYQGGYAQQQTQPPAQAQQQPATQSGYAGAQGYPSNQQYPQQAAYNQYYNYQQQQPYPNY